LALLDLRQMNIEELGDFVITFRSYIDLRKSENATVKDKSRSRVRSTRLRNTGSSTPTQNGAEANENVLIIDPDYEVEWDLDVDSIGRKIISEEGENPIRLPFHEILFTVVAGSPASLSIDEFGKSCARILI